MDPISTHNESSALLVCLACFSQHYPCGLSIAHHHAIHVHALHYVGTTGPGVINKNSIKSAARRS